MGNSNSNIRIDIEAGVNPAGFNAGVDQVDRLGAAVQRVNQPMIEAERSANKMQLTAGQLRMATQQLPLQFQDIWVSLAAGQNPMMVMIQQGTQISGSFGGAGNAAKAMAGYLMGLINPLTLAATAVAAGAVAWYKWGESAREAAEKSKAALAEAEKLAKFTKHMTPAEEVQDINKQIAALKEKNFWLKQNMPSMASVVADEKSKLWSGPSDRRSTRDISLATEKANLEAIANLERNRLDIETQIARQAEAEANAKNKKTARAYRQSDAGQDERDYQRITDSATSRIAVLEAQAKSTDKLTQSEKDLIEFDAQHKPSRDKRIEQQRLAARGALDEAAALERTAQAQQAAAKAREEANKAAALVDGLARDYTADINKKNRDLNAPLMSAADKAHADNLDAVAAAAARVREEIAKMTLSEEERAQSIYKVNQAESEQAQKMEDLRQQVERNNASWEYGANVALRSYRDEITNVAKQSEAMVGRAFKGMEDALVKFVRTGKLDFASLADSIINDMIRIEIQRSIMQPLTSAMDSAGGLGGLLGDFFGMGSSTPAATSTGATAASWTSTSMPMLPSFAVGTDYVPHDMIAQIHKGERIVPAAFNPANGGGASAPSFTVNVINAPAGTQVQQRSDGNGGMTVDVLIEQIESGIARNVSRGSGALASTMERSYGLNRAAGAY